MKIRKRTSGLFAVSYAIFYFGQATGWSLDCLNDQPPNSASIVIASSVGLDEAGILNTVTDEEISFNSPNQSDRGDHVRFYYTSTSVNFSCVGFLPART